MTGSLEKARSETPVRMAQRAHGSDHTTAAGARTAEARLKKACQDFESIFISMILRQMLDSIPKSSPSSAGTGLMSALADQGVAEHLARSGGIGLADVMYKQLSKTLVEQSPKV